MTPPLPLEDAQRRLLAAVEPLGSETVNADAALGRWLAEPVVAVRTSPDADLSAMDGFATAGAGPWRIVGESAAGHPFAGSLQPGQAVRISTGAQVPAGGEAILLREDGEVSGESVAAPGDSPGAQHIRRHGFDFTAGDALLEAGTLIGPAQLALALSGGVRRLAVGRRASIAIIDSGDELVADPADVRPGLIPVTNGPMIAALCDGLTARTLRIGPVGDDRQALCAAFEEAADVDLIVTSGGASVGDHDLVRPALEAHGATIDFWRVAIRPGKPLLVARKGRQVIVGLPGNPGSAFVTAILFVLPLLRRLAGAAADVSLPRAVPAILAGPAAPGGRRREFLRARWTAGGIEPIAERDSSALRSLAAADALIDRAAGAAAAGPGEVVSVIPLGFFGTS